METATTAMKATTLHPLLPIRLVLSKMRHPREEQVQVQVQEEAAISRAGAKGTSMSGADR